MSNVGLSVVEGVSSGLTPFKLPSKRNIGLLMERERGRENYPYLVSSLAEDRLVFGGVEANKYGAIVMRNLIRNAQGYATTIYGVRIVGNGSVAATGTLSIPSPNSVTLTVTAGYKGGADKGIWGNDISVNFYSKGFKVRGKYQLEVIYKGRTVEVYQGATCAEIQSAINEGSSYVFVSFSAEPTTGNLSQNGTGTITTLTTGTPETLATRAIQITTAGTAGNTIEVAVGATILGTYTVVSLDTVDDVAAGLAADISGGTHGYTAVAVTDTLTITAPTGTGATANGLVANVTVTGTTAATPTSGTFTGGVTAIAPAVSATVTGVGTAFNTQLQAGSVLYDEDGNLIGIVQSVGGATTLTLTAVANVSLPAGSDFTFSYYATITGTLSGGVYVAPTENDFYPVADPVAPKGFACLDGVDVQILAHSEFHTLTMATEVRSYAESRKDVIYVCNLPFNASDTVLTNYANTLQSNNTSFVAGYNAWVKTSDESGNYVWVPSIGCVLGAAYIRVPNIQGDFIHIPPAGYDSAFTDIIDVTPNKITPDRINRLTRELTVNSVVFQQGKGFFVISSRSYSTNSLYHSIHIRMQTNYYVRILANNLGFAIQKPNTPELKKDLFIACWAFFKNEYDNGALERSVSFEEACTIICDLSNNPRSQDRKLLNLDIDWIPTEATEALRISLNRNDGSLIVQSIS